MASIYADKLSQKNDYRTALIDRKDKWKAEELLDKREPRSDAAYQSEKRDRLARKHEEKKAHLE